MTTNDRHYIAAGRSLAAVLSTLEALRVSREALQALRPDIGPDAIVYPVSRTLILPDGAEVPDGLRRLKSGRYKAKPGKAGKDWNDRIGACQPPNTSDLTRAMFGSIFALSDMDIGGWLPSVGLRSLKDGRHLLTLPAGTRETVEPPDAIPINASEFWALIEADATAKEG